MSREKRQFVREIYRVGCKYRIGDKLHNGIVSDLSARGIFVLSSHLPEEGSELMLVLHASAGEIELHGRVSRLQRSHRAASSVVSGAGFGVELANAPENFFALLVELGLS